ncbi:MAG TPA: ABC transporter ATP-binding protein [Fimbriimonadaceae bacterium]|nr:ABC transporter ATP-binding protein [Fimbriimonadaceae bacterium]
MLEVLGLKKKYGELVAVNGIEFSLQPGDIFGFIGSNGAGKTTTIKMLATLLEPTTGTATLNGIDVTVDPMQIKRMIGYMPDFFGLYDDVKVWEYLDFFATIYEVAAKEHRKVIDSVLELTDLTVKKDSFVSSLSRGMQQRLCLAKCLVHDPYMLLLDEPASGLDPRARAELKDLIAELGRMGKIVIVSSHILPELSDFCNTVGIIERGELLAFGPVRDVVKTISLTKVVEVHVLDAASEVGMWLHGKPHVLNTHMMAPTVVKVEFDGTEQDQAEMLKALVDNGYKVTEFREEPIDLEDVFLRVTKGEVN